ncbi:MAG: DUF2339 domain-containing protein [Weeksellaceae bacterium]|nr:DUF2339 domain-containing protein [Weeksellaceae bacterium]
MSQSGKIDELQRQLHILLDRQEEFQRQIKQLQFQIYELREEAEIAAPKSLPTEAKLSENYPSAQPHPQSAPKAATPRPKQKIGDNIQQTFKQAIPGDLEKFIGENLINKIGILILVIGAGIGVNYAIDHDLISPLGRIILGYLLGISLFAISIKLKKNYDAFSAVLQSGALAIFYFITYAAYQAYALIPNLVAFFMMVLFTIFTVLSALAYNRRIIALMGLVGAYAIPFLLGSETGDARILFAYITLINVGMLYISFRKYWKILFHSAFLATWGIYIAWMIQSQLGEANFALGFTFLTVFFIIFYTTFLAYKIIRKEKFSRSDVLFLLANSILYFILGYFWVDSVAAFGQYLSLFAIFNATLHLLVGQIIFKQKLVDQALLHMVVGLVLVFTVIAIPLQFSGNWITLMWAGLALILFWTGKRQSVRFYVQMSYPVMLLAFLSFVFSSRISSSLYTDNNFTPVFNQDFLYSLIFIAIFAVINYIQFGNKNTPNASNTAPRNLLHYIIPAILFYALFFTGYDEVGRYWMQRQWQLDQLVADHPQVDYSLLLPTYYPFRVLWQTIYTLTFLSVFSAINLYKIRNYKLQVVSTVLLIFALFFFATEGLHELDKVRELVLFPSSSPFAPPTGIMHHLIRYISIGAAILAGWFLWQNGKKIKFPPATPQVLELALHALTLWVATSELLHWLQMLRLPVDQDIAQRILWGIYALVLVALGIYHRKQYLRIAAMILFAYTLIQVVFWDLSHLDTISKTLVFLALGVLLLIISFLYNKYKNLMHDHPED